MEKKIIPLSNPLLVRLAKAIGQQKIAQERDLTEKLFGFFTSERPDRNTLISGMVIKDFFYKQYVDPRPEEYLNSLKTINRALTSIRCKARIGIRKSRQRIPLRPYLRDVFHYDLVIEPTLSFRLTFKAFSADLRTSSASTH